MTPETEREFQRLIRAGGIYVRSGSAYMWVAIAWQLVTIAAVLGCAGALWILLDGMRGLAATTGVR